VSCAQLCCAGSRGEFRRVALRRDLSSKGHHADRATAPLSCPLISLHNSGNSFQSMAVSNRGLVMSEERLRSYAVLLLRLALGVMFIAHSIIYMTLTLPACHHTERCCGALR
jgi:hypothetical protein